MTPGNISGIQGQAGLGKTSVIAALIASRICAEMGIERDTLGITADPAARGVVLVIDTEQSLYDAYQNKMRTLRRGGVCEAPAWLHWYALAGFSASDLRLAVSVLVDRHASEGFYAIIIDGLGDMAEDVNDPKESNELVSWGHALAIERDCPVICVLHENPGSDTGKGRGHLGSQLTRKAEAMLRLVKNDEVTTVFSQKARRAPIFEKDGPRFRWSDEAGMHVSVQSAGITRADAKRDELIELRTEIFDGQTKLKFTDMSVAIQKARGCTSRTAERKLAEMKQLKLIRFQGFGLYSPTTDT
jgi:hypothetical protein